MCILKRKDRIIRNNILEWVKAHQEEARTLWWWLCNKDYEAIGDRLFVIKTEIGIPVCAVEDELTRRYLKFLKDIKQYEAQN